MSAHLTTVVYRRRVRDWWRRTYWVRCWHCDELELGPIIRTSELPSVP